MGVASSRDPFISRLEAAPTECIFNIKFGFTDKRMNALLTAARDAGARGQTYLNNKIPIGKQLFSTNPVFIA